MKQIVLVTCMLMTVALEGWSQAQYDKEARQLLDEISAKYKDMSFKEGFERVRKTRFLVQWR